MMLLILMIMTMIDVGDEEDDDNDCYDEELKLVVVHYYNHQLIVFLFVHWNIVTTYMKSELKVTNATGIVCHNLEVLGTNLKCTTLFLLFQVNSVALIY